MLPAEKRLRGSGKGVAKEVTVTGYKSFVSLPMVNKADHSGFETQKRHYQKSKTGVSVTPKMRHLSTQFFVKNILNASFKS